MVSNVEQAERPHIVRSTRAFSVDPGAWNAWDAMRTAMGDKIVAVSELMGFRGTSYLEKLRLPPEPVGNGVPTWAARLYDFMFACVKAGQPLDEAIAPLVWLAHRFGFELHSRTENIDGGRPWRVLHKLANVSGQGEALLLEVLDPTSPGGSEITRTEALANRHRALEVAEQHEQAAREIRATFRVGAA